MKLFLILALAAVAALAETRPAAAGALYDMSIFLNQPHPFSRAFSRAFPRAFARPPQVAPQVAPAPRPVPMRPVAAPLQKAEAADEATGRPLWGVISEVRLGFLFHDQGLFSSHKEAGADINLEVLFTSPGLLEAVGSPRPHLGFNAHTLDETHQAYLGLTWEWTFLRRAFFDFGFGGAVHSGETTSGTLGRKDLGCPVLFRAALDLGYRFAGRHAVMVSMSHLSNAKLCDNNEGLENIGIRYGYAF